MALLQYDISVVGVDNIHKAMASIEARLRQHSSTVSRMTGVSPGAAKKLTGVGASTQMRSALNAEARDRAKSLREELSLKNKVNAVVVRGIQQESRLKEQTQRKELAHQRQLETRRVEFARATIGHGIARVGQTVKAVGKAGLALTGVAGAGLAAAGVQEAASMDEKVRRLIIASRQGGETSKYNPAGLTSKFNQTSVASGVGADDLVTGVQSFVAKTGDLDSAIKHLDTFATTAQASGASVSDIANAAADLSEKMDIKSVDQMREALASLYLEGKKGAFEIRDLAQYLPEVAAAAQSFGVKGTSGVAKLGGILQIARQATGSGAEAATSVEAMFRQMTAKSGKIQSGEAFGGNAVSVFEKNDPTKPLRDFNEILADMITASKGNLVQLQEVFDVRGIRAVNPLISKFRDANNAAGGGSKGAAAGRAAVLAGLSDAGNVKGGFGEIEQDSAEAMKSFNVQMEIVSTKLKQAIASELFPEIQKLTPEIARLVPYVGKAARSFVDLVKFVSDHPFASIGLVIAGQLAADVAKAQLGNLLSRLLTGAMGGGTGGKVGGALGVAGGALAAYGIGTSLIDASFDSKDSAQRSMVENSIRSMNAGTAVRAGMTGSGGAAAAQLENVQRLIVAGEGKKAGDAADFTGGVASFLGGGMEGIANFATAGAVGKSFAQQNEASAAAEQLPALYAQAADLIKAMQDAVAKQGAAAAETSVAASKLGSAGLPNRGATPSPIKPY